MVLFVKLLTCKAAGDLSQIVPAILTNAPVLLLYAVQSGKAAVGKAAGMNAYLRQRRRQ